MKVGYKISIRQLYQHNCASLNLQYKAVNTMDEIHTCVLLKNSVKFLKALFLVKKGPNNKNLNIILFTYILQRSCSR